MSIIIFFIGLFMFNVEVDVFVDRKFLGEKSFNSFSFVKKRKFEDLKDS